MGTIAVGTNPLGLGQLGYDLDHLLMFGVFQCKMERVSPALCFLEDVVGKDEALELKTGTAMGWEL